MFLRVHQKRLLAVLVAIAGVVFAKAAPQRGDNTAASDLALFAFDDEWLPLRDNLKLTLQHPKRYPGNPVLSRGDDPDGPDGYGTALYGTVLHEKDKFRM